MIRSFANETTEKIFQGVALESVPLKVQQEALVRLQVLNAATELKDLEAIAGYSLEPQQASRTGYHCVRIGQMARICFRWDKGHAHEVELFEYH